MNYNTCEDQTFSPKDTGERVILTFDFSPALATGETLVQITSRVCVVEAGEDTNPTDLFDGAAGVNLSGTSVQQPVDRGVTGVSYRITIFCLTSAGQRLACPGSLTIEIA